MKIEKKKFLPADAIILTGDRDRADEANYNQTAGPAESLFIDGKLICSGGIRVTVGESWAIFSEEAKAMLAQKEHSSKLKAVLKTLREQMESMQREHQLTRLFAEPIVSERFCKAMGFKKQNNIYVR